jgi:hypothetical protein
LIRASHGAGGNVFKDKCFGFGGFVLGIALENAEYLEERRARAAEYFVGLRKMIDRAFKNTRESNNEGCRQVEAATSEDDIDRIIKHCETCERLLGALDVHVSPYRSNTLLWHRARIGGTCQ